MKQEECNSFFKLADQTRICKKSEGLEFCFCANLIKAGICPIGCRE